MNLEPRTIRPEELTPVELAPGVALRVFVSGAATGSKELTVCSATFSPGAELPCHTHPTSEVIYAYSGYATAVVESRAYTLRPGDLLHVPAGVPHLVRNPSGEEVCLYTFFPTPAPERDLVLPPEDATVMLYPPGDAPEQVIRAGDGVQASANWPIRPERIQEGGFSMTIGSERAVCQRGEVTYVHASEVS